MHTGEKLGAALREAMTRKGVKQEDVARAFGVKQPSVSEWLKFGRIGKKHIPLLVEWFSDVVGADHWGLPPAWAGHDKTLASPPPPPPQWPFPRLPLDQLAALTEREIGIIEEAASSKFEEVMARRAEGAQRKQVNSR